MLEALERGWQDRLPEAAYLVAMLQRLETYLDLPSNSLSVSLPSASSLRPDHPRRCEPGRFGPSS